MDYLFKIPAAGNSCSSTSLTFGAFDLFMSLEYQWFSTMYGVWFFASGMRAALAVTIIACLYLKTKGELKGFINKLISMIWHVCLWLSPFSGLTSVFLSIFLSTVLTYQKKHFGTLSVKSIQILVKFPDGFGLAWD